MAREAHVFDRGSGVARRTPLIAERRAAMAPEAHVFDRGSWVARHTPLIAERRKVAVLSLHVTFKSTCNLPDISMKRSQ